MTKDELTEIGSSYKKACDFKVLCHRLASHAAGKRLDVLVYNEAAQAELEKMPDFQVGVMLMCDWGADVPGELMEEAHVVPNLTLPGELELH